MIILPIAERHTEQEGKENKRDYMSTFTLQPCDIITSVAETGGREQCAAEPQLVILTLSERVKN